MKLTLLTLLALIILTSCSNPVTIENLYDKCKYKTEYSIVNFMVQFQLTRDRSTKQLLGLFDNKITKTESIDLCQCFVSKFKKQNKEIQAATLASIQTIDDTVNSELKLFADEGLMSNISNRDSYAKIEAFIPEIPVVKKLLAEASYDKFERQSCKITD